MKETKQIKYLAIYCDDIVIIHNDKSYLHQLRKEIQEYLSINLKLELSNYQVFPVDKRGLDFIGYKFYSHNYILIRDSIKRKFIKMIRTNKNKESIAAYNGWLNHGNCKNLKNKYLNVK